MDDRELAGAIEIIPNLLYFVCLRTVPKGTVATSIVHTTPNASSASQFRSIVSGNRVFFSVDEDEDMQYEPFFADFGPLHLGKTVRFCRRLDALRRDHGASAGGGADGAVADGAGGGAAKKIYFFSSHDGHRRANAASLMGCYSVIVLKRSAEEAFRPFLNAYPPFVPFRDASYGVCSFNLTILDVLRGLSKAIEHKFFDYETFDLESYSYYERVEHGDMNWVLPGKFLAFSGPSAVRTDPCVFTPEDYIPLFKKWGITAVVRFNKKAYDRKRFVDAGINHHDLYFVDGGIPTDAILRRFLEICDTEASLAVHCKAGLGRTGTCIACWIIRQYQFTAAETIGWLRLCRPGSVIGPQQHFLKEIESRLWKQGKGTQAKVSDLTTSMHSMNIQSPPQPRKIPRGIAPSLGASARVASSGLHVSESAESFTSTNRSLGISGSPAGSAGLTSSSAYGSSLLLSSPQPVATSSGSQVAPGTAPGSMSRSNLYSSQNGGGYAAANSPYGAPSTFSFTGAGSRSGLQNSAAVPLSAIDHARLRQTGHRSGDDLSRSLPIAGGSPDAPQVSIQKNHFRPGSSTVNSNLNPASSRPSFSTGGLYRNYAHPPPSAPYPGTPARR
eukprot:ANDGO_00683.mRNA.1 putative tyrosine-protein phosphatase cdc-14